MASRPHDESRPTIEKDVLSHLSQALLVADENNIIIEIYGFTEQLFSRSRDYFIGRPVNSLDGFGNVVADICDRVRTDRGSYSAYNIPTEQPLGDVELVDFHATTLLLETGLLETGLLETGGASNNQHVLLTVQPRKVNAFADKRNDMVSASKSLGGLASMLAHEIKNPLSGIRGAAQLISRKLEGTQRQLPDMIVKEVDRVSKLVQQLESFSETSGNKIEEVNIHEVLDHVLQVAVSGFASQASIKPYFDPSLPTVAGNFDLLVQVFLNLLKNAVEAGGPDVEISISTKFKHGIWITNGSGSRIQVPVMITIEDNGPGLPKDLEGHLFEPFVSSKEAGTGLGLALVARYTSEMGGTVSCENRQGVGAVFRVQMPLFKREQ
jgi:two-component system nitrogen regulation sensor histidine kinase GlnL